VETSRWGQANRNGRDGEWPPRRLKHSFLDLAKEFLIPEFFKILTVVGPNTEESMAEKTIVDGKVFYKYKDGTMVPEEKHLTRMANLAYNKVKPESKEMMLIRKKARNASIYNVKQHLDEYLKMKGFFDLPASKKAKKWAGIDEKEKCTWRQIMWSVFSTEAIQGKNVRALFGLIRLEEMVIGARQHSEEMELKTIKTKWEMDGKGKQIEGEIVENNFGEEDV
jgi:hypothetical protein